MRVTNDVRKLLAWLEGAPVSEAQIVAAGFNHTLDKALMLNFVEMNLPKATVFDHCSRPRRFESDPTSKAS